MYEFSKWCACFQPSIVVCGCYHVYSSAGACAHALEHGGGQRTVWSPCCNICWALLHGHARWPEWRLLSSLPRSYRHTGVGITTPLCDMGPRDLDSASHTCSFYPLSHLPSPGLSYGNGHRTLHESFSFQELKGKF